MPSNTSLRGRRIGLLESRKTAELAALVERLGGSVISAPTVRERPRLDEVGGFVDGLKADRFRVAIFLTGVGATTLFQDAERRGELPGVLDALAKLTLACRGPKPLAVLRRSGLTPSIVTVKPHTTTELLEALKSVSLEDAGVVLVHYGERNQELAGALRARGARLTEICPYEWALPEDTGPIVTIVQEAIAQRLDALLFTSQVQCRHLFNVAESHGLASALADTLNKETIIGAIGPVCAEALRSFGLTPDVTPAAPNMAALIAAIGDYFELTQDGESQMANGKSKI